MVMVMETKMDHNDMFLRTDVVCVVVLEVVGKVATLEMKEVLDIDSILCAPCLPSIMLASHMP